MSVRADLVMPAEEFGLAETFGAVDGLDVEVEQAVATPPDRALPYIRARADTDDLAPILRSDSSVRNVERVRSLPSGSLYRVEWADAVRATHDRIVDTEATILTLVAHDEVWHFGLRFADRAIIDSLETVLTDHGHSVEFDHIRTAEGVSVGSGFALTDVQRATLEAALEHGYYDIPREATTSDLADELGVSQQALSQRLRRAHEQLVTQVISGGSNRLET